MLRDRKRKVEEIAEMVNMSTGRVQLHIELGRW